MKLLEKTLLKACAYTVAIDSLFYIFLLIAKDGAASLNASRFFILLLFGAIISSAELVLELLSIKGWRYIVLHFAVLLASFLVVFTLSGNVQGRASSVIAATVVFTLSYILIYLVKLGGARLVGRLDGKLDSAPKKEKKSKSKPYRSMFDDTN